MKKLISCEYNFDNCCVELKFTDGSMIAIDTIAVESEVARNMYERSDVKIAASEPVARRKRATHAGEVSHAISRKKLHGKI